MERAFTRHNNDTAAAGHLEESKASSSPSPSWSWEKLSPMGWTGLQHCELGANTSGDLSRTAKAISPPTFLLFLKEKTVKTRDRYVGA